MTDAPNYDRATNAAYEILQKYAKTFPQVDIYEIITSYPNVKVHSYSEIADRLGMKVKGFIKDIAPSEYGYTIYDKEHERWEVFYNDQKCKSTIRSTLAHELGHIVLKHTSDGSVEDREANCFARNLLCPVPIREEFGLKTLSDYCNAFDISVPMAQVAIDRNSSDTYYITKQNYNKVNDRVYCFFTGCTLAELYGY